MEKIRKKKWLCFGAAAVLGAVLFCFFWLSDGRSVSAAWVDQTIDGHAEYSRFPLEHYFLDISGGGGFLSEMGTGLMNFLANALFSVSRLLSYFCGWVMEEAYAVDFLGSSINSIAQNIHAIAGVDAGGFREHGLLPSLAPLLILLAGGYFVWTGIFRRKAAQAAVNLAAFSMVFVLGMGTIAYVGGYMTMINTFQQEFNAEIMEISSRITLGESGTDGTDMVHQMRDNLFLIMVKNPYLMFQYGTSDVEAVGGERIDGLLELEPGSDERQEMVEKEVEELGNTYMGEGHLAERFGMCLVVLLVNIVIGGSVLMFAAMLIMAQVLFVLYMSFFPVALVFSMFPGSGNRLGKILGQCLDVILMRPAVSLILTVVLSISMLCYRLGGTSNYLWAMFLQGVTFVVALMKTGEFLGYMKIGNRQQKEKSILRYIAGGIGVRTVYRGAGGLVRNTYEGAKKGGRIFRRGAYGAAGYVDAKANRDFYLKNAALKEGTSTHQSERRESGAETVRQKPEKNLRREPGTEAGQARNTGKASLQNSGQRNTEDLGARHIPKQEADAGRGQRSRSAAAHTERREPGADAVRVRDTGKESLQNSGQRNTEDPGAQRIPKQKVDAGQVRNTGKTSVQSAGQGNRKDPAALHIAKQEGNTGYAQRNIRAAHTEKRRPGVPLRTGREMEYQRENFNKADRLEKKGQKTWSRTIERKRNVEYEKKQNKI